jgi:error-prone DNA polymerase
MGARLILVRGRVQYAEDAPAGGVIHLVAESLEDRTADLDRLSAPGGVAPRFDPPYAPGDEPGRPRPRHPRNVRPIPRSRDFH